MARTVLPMIAGAALICAAAPAPIARQEKVPPFDVRRELLLPRSMRIDDIADIASTAGTGPGNVWETNVPRTIPIGASIRIHLQVTAPASTAAWRVVIKDDRGRVVETIDGAMLGSQTAWWTDEVPTPRAKVELWMDSAAAAPQIVIDRYMFRVTPSSDQGSVGTDNSLPITDSHVPARARALRAPIARIRFVVPDGEAICTGFLVGADLVMTNEHCLNKKSDVGGVLVEFNYDSEGAPTKRFRVIRVEADDFGLDYSVLRLSGPATGQGRLFLDPSSTLTQGARLFLLQHPEGKPKRAAFSPNCSIDVAEVFGRAEVKTDFEHVCDTKPGSSGAPIASWETSRVVGVHHLGYRPGIDKAVNQAVHIRQIVENLRAQVDAGNPTRAVLDEVTRPK